MKKKLNKFMVGILVSVFVLGTSTANIANALLDPRYTYENCIQTMSGFVTEKQAEFFQFLDTHFQSKKRNSDLISVAIEAYIQYKDGILGELPKFESGGNMGAMSVLSSYDACIRIAESAVADGKTMLKQHVMTTSRVKNTTTLLEKYKAINKRLADMNLLIAEWVASFKTFSGKLSIFLKDCLIQ